MSRQNDLMTISLEDVVHTLRECQRDWKYSGRFQPMLAFASELTGISEDGLMEMVDGERELEGNLEGGFEPRIVDFLKEELTDGTVYAVEIVPERFVDVQVREDGTVGFLSELKGKSDAYTSVFDKSMNEVPGEVRFDREAVLKVVKEHVKGQSLDGRLEDASERHAAQQGERIKDISQDKGERVKD